MNDWQVPLDDLHSDCLDARDDLRLMFASAVDQVRQWIPENPPPRKTQTP